MIVKLRLQLIFQHLIQQLFFQFPTETSTEDKGVKQNEDYLAVWEHLKNLFIKEQQA